MEYTEKLFKRLVEFSTFYGPKELGEFFKVPAINFTKMIKEGLLIDDVSPFRKKRFTAKAIVTQISSIQQYIMEKYYNRIISGKRVTWYKYLSAIGETVPENKSITSPISFSQEILPGQITLIELNCSLKHKQYWEENHFDDSVELFCPELGQVIFLTKEERESLPFVKHTGKRIIACPCGSIEHFYVLEE